MWERDGLVYTCVSDAPSDVFTKMVGGLVGPGRSTPQSVVDFVLDPFSGVGTVPRCMKDRGIPA